MRVAIDQAQGEIGRSRDFWTAEGVVGLNEGDFIFDVVELIEEARVELGQ